MKARRHPALVLSTIIRISLYLGVLFCLVFAAKRGLREKYGVDPKLQEAKQELETLASLIERSKAKCGSYPSSEVALAEVPELKAGWKGQTDQDGKPLDPWGEPYHYELAGDRFRILSYSEDRRPGGAGMNADIAKGPASD